ncbi:hypothetical protein GY45DRAFT_1237847, partial [Cubamyces sp. BRFM 1775]
KIREASIFIFPPAVTSSRSAYVHQYDECKHNTLPVERSACERDEMYEGTFNEWMNLISSCTG